MASTLITPVADALKTTLAGLGVTPTVTAYRWAPRMLSGTGPFAVILLPTLTRTEVDEGEVELGSDDWRMDFGVELYVDLTDPDRDQNRLVDLLEAFIRAVDDNYSLGIATVEDSKVVTGDPFLDQTDEARPLIAYECRVHVWRRRPT